MFLCIFDEYMERRVIAVLVFLSQQNLFAGVPCTDNVLHQKACIKITGYIAKAFLLHYHIVHQATQHLSLLFIPLHNHHHQSHL